MRDRALRLGGSLALVLAACGFRAPSAQPAPGGDDSGGDDAAVLPVDTDGDSVVDDADNCPTVANADQHDHDGDHRGDACDVCPHVTDDGADRDHDGVGDMCDPRPDDPGDRIAYFEGFYGPVTWTPVVGTSGAWSVANGALHEARIDSAYQLVRDAMPDLDNVYVEARLQVNQITSDTGARRSAGVVAGYRANNAYWYCGLAAASSASEVEAGKVFSDLSFDYLSASFAAQMPGDWAIARVRTSQPVGGDTTITCSIERGGVTGMATYTAAANASGDVGFRTNGADTSFDYVFVVAVPRP